MLNVLSVYSTTIINLMNKVVLDNSLDNKNVKTELSRRRNIFIYLLNFEIKNMHSDCLTLDNNLVENLKAQF